MMHTAKGVAPRTGRGPSSMSHSPYHRRASPRAPPPAPGFRFAPLGHGVEETCASAALSEAGACPFARAGQARTPQNNAFMLQALRVQQQRNAALMSQPQSQALPDPVPAPSLQVVRYNPNQGRGRGRGRGGRGRGGRGGGQGPFLAPGPCFACGGAHLIHACPWRGV